MESSGSAGGEAEPASPLENPFKLIKVKGNKEGLPSSGLQSFPSSATGLSPTSGSPTLSPSSPNPSTKVIALNPFSLSKFQKTTAPLNGSSISRISPSTVTTGLGKEATDLLINDLQNEIAGLKKEIDSKDAKLSSSMRSIKMFWSPELKKERAGRKEDVERMLMLKNQYDVLSADIKKKSSRIKELEYELEIEKENKKSDNSPRVQKLPIIEVTDTANDDIRKLEEKNKELEVELCRVEEEFKKAQQNFELKIVELSARDTFIKALKTEIEEWKLKQAQHLLDQKVSDDRKTYIDNLEEQLKVKQNDLEELCLKIQRLKEDVNVDKEIVAKKTLLVQNYENKMQKAAQEREALEVKYQTRELECKSLSSQLEERGKDIETLKQKLAKLQTELESDRDQHIELENLIKESEERNIIITNDLHTLREQSSIKEQDISSLQSKLSEIKMTLDEKENLISEKEQMINSMKASRRRESVEAEDLKGILDAKNREIESLDKKYETLDTYLSHRETALSHARDELAEIKSKHANCTSTINFMESQITDKDQLISRLEKQRNRLEKEKEDEVSNSNSHKDQIEALNKQSHEKDDLVKDLEAKVGVLKSKLTEIQKVSPLESVLSEKEQTIKSLEDELNKSKEVINKLEKDLTEKRSKEDHEKNSIKPAEDVYKRHSGTSPVKDSKMIKQLWDEISKKDSRLQDLEKQLKERGKQLSNLRKNQTAEREKQAQYLTDKSKYEDESQNKFTDLQGEMLKKDDRITMLEDALRESVSIAAEREELLAQHVELSEGASQTIHELEADTDRLTMEKGITNIKNAFLILSLGERDAVVASLKSLRKRNLEELMNIKQTALLAAISEKDANIALLELQSSSKGRKQEIKQLKQEKDKLVNELKEQTQHRITITNNEDNKDGMLYKDLEDAPVELVLQALRNLSDSSDKLEYYIDALLSFVKERNLEILKEVPSLQKRNPKGMDKLRNAGKSQLLREMQKLEEDCSQLKSFVDILLEKLEAV